ARFGAAGDEYLPPVDLDRLDEGLCARAHVPLGLAGTLVRLAGLLLGRRSRALLGLADRIGLSGLGGSFAGSFRSAAGLGVLSGLLVRRSSLRGGTRVGAGCFFPRLGNRDQAARLSGLLHQRDD